MLGAYKKEGWWIRTPFSQAKRKYKDAFSIIALMSASFCSAEEEDGKGKKVRLDAFTSQTNKLDVDKHM